jgi:hypothetical protein
MILSTNSFIKTYVFCSVVQQILLVWCTFTKTNVYVLDLLQSWPLIWTVTSSSSPYLWYQNVMWHETRNYKLWYSWWFSTFLAKFIWDVNGTRSFTRSVTCALPLRPVKILMLLKSYIIVSFRDIRWNWKTNWSFILLLHPYVLLNNGNFRLVWANLGILYIHSFYFGVYIAWAKILDCSNCSNAKCYMVIGHFFLWSSKFLALYEFDRCVISSVCIKIELWHR